MPDTISESEAASTDDTVTRLFDEGPIGMAQAAGLVGTFRQGKRTHPSTITRWALHGVKLAGGRVVKLESFQLNGRLCTSKPALIRFIRAQQVPAGQADSQAGSKPIGRPKLSNAALQATAENDAIFGERKPA